MNNLSAGKTPHVSGMAKKNAPVYKAVHNSSHGKPERARTWQRD